MSLMVDAEGTAVVRAPIRISKREIERFVEEHAAWIEKQRSKQQKHREQFPPLSREEIAELKKEAKAFLAERTAHFSELMKLTPVSVKITSAEKRFGSCSAKNGICYSYRLMRYPKMAIDYVVVHELAHIRHKNHGRQFYALVESVLPDYRYRQSMLKKGFTE